MNPSTRQLLQARRERGFSVIELMVSVVVGLLALMFATRLILSAEQNKQASLGGSESMQNGMLALFSISGDIAQAGFGLNDPIIAGCNTVFTDDSGYQLATVARGGANVTPLAAAVIESNDAGADRLSLYSGSSMSGTGTLRVTANYVAGSVINVDRVPYGFAKNDVILVAPETVGAVKCALAQLSSDPAVQAPPPSQQVVNIASGTGFRFNTGSLGVAYTGSQTRLFNLGPARSLAFHTWSVDKGYLQLRSTDLAGSSRTPATVIDNVVSIKAQYGLDTRAGAAFDPQQGLQIGRWSATMTDADGNGVAGSAGDFQRIAALRVAVVARSKNPEKPGADGVCHATTTLPSVFAKAEPYGVLAVPVSVNVAVPDDPIDWKCYRYRVFETIVPLRNSAWRPTA
jgi:type IV pilus assembly protein PilW